MDFSLDDQQVALANTLSRFVTDEYAAERRSGFLQKRDGYDPDSWGKLTELGFVALFLGTESGGLGGSTTDMMVALQALGPGLLVDPWVPTLIAARLVEMSGTDAQKAEWLEKLMAGEAVLGFGHTEASGWDNIAHCATKAKASSDGGFILDGEKTLVLAAGASHVVLSARTHGDVDDREGIGLFLLPIASTGLTRRQYRLADGSMAEAIELKECRAERSSLLGETGAASPILETVIAEICILLASEAIGILDAMMVATTEHLRSRKQFGVPLGSFQVLQHRMADCAAELELLRALVLKASITFADPTSDVIERLIAGFGAKALCAAVSIKIAEECVQFHGAIGITEELWVARAFKRLRVIAALFGDERAQSWRCDQLRATGNSR